MSFKTRKLLNPLLLIIALGAIGVLGYYFKHFNEDRVYSVYPMTKYYDLGVFGDTCSITTRYDYYNTSEPIVAIRVPCLEYRDIILGQEWPVMAGPRVNHQDVFAILGASLVLVIIVAIRTSSYIKKDRYKRNLL